MTKIKAWGKNILYFVDGGKEKINLKLIAAIMGSVFSILFVITSIGANQEDAGFSRKTDKKIISAEGPSTQSEDRNIQANVFKAVEAPPVVKQQKLSSTSNSPPVQLKAQQVISRNDGEEKQGGLPTGSNFIGKLLSAVDTRDMSSMVKVLLPYGARFQGEEYLAKDTVLIGRANYSGKGERVFLTFERAISPNGLEIPIQAHALDTSDYANGIKGDTHSEAGLRIAGTLGLTMISGMTDVLTEKTAHGDFGVTVPKASMKNALFHGVSKVSEMEAARQAEAMTQTPPYVTLNAGIDMIISLSSRFSFK